jgi:cytochrome c2
LLYYPYQHNRSAAAFHELPTSNAFPDFSPAFLQVSWNGRIFAIATPEKGRSFSYRWPLQLDFPSLNAATHPVTGELYAVGLGISGYKPTTPKVVGLAAVSQANPLPTPALLAIKNNQVIIKWNRPLEENEAVTPMVPALRLYDVKRSKKYGSGHYLASGKAGEHRLQPTSVVLSSDRQTQTFTFPALFSADIFDLKLQVSHGAISAPMHIYTRPHDLPKASSRDLALLTKAEPAALKPGNAAKGETVFKTYACNGCHSLAKEKLTGPPLKGLSDRLTPVLIRESIVQPAKVITKGYPAAMPSFDGVMTPQELEDLLAYLGTLKN